MPEPKPLLRLKYLAEKFDQHELAIVFRDQLSKTLGVPDEDSWKGVLPLEPRTSYERLQVTTLLRTLRNRRFADIEIASWDTFSEPREEVKRILERHKLRREWRRANREFVQRVIATGAGYWDEAGKR